MLSRESSRDPCRLVKSQAVLASKLYCITEGSAKRSRHCCTASHFTRKNLMYSTWSQNWTCQAMSHYHLSLEGDNTFSNSYHLGDTNSLYSLLNSTGHPRSQMPGRPSRNVLLWCDAGEACPVGVVHRESLRIQAHGLGRSNGEYKLGAVRASKCWGNEQAEVNFHWVTKASQINSSGNRHIRLDFYYKYVLKHFACIYTIVITLNSPTLPRTRKVGMFRISNIGLVIEVTLQEHRGPFRN